MHEISLINRCWRLYNAAKLSGDVKRRQILPRLEDARSDRSRLTEYLARRHLGARCASAPASNLEAGL